MNNADVAWMLTSTALVLLMTPALAFFYGGLVRSKNALNTMMMSFISLGFAGVAWALLGYSLAFAPGSSFVGGLGFSLLKGVTLDPQGAIPHALFMAFQGTFAVITAALISGAIVERMRFSAYIVFITLWVLAVYAPVAHWVWGGGWLATMGALDFAGGTVVHVNAAAAALVASIVVGPRFDHGRQAIALGGDVGCHHRLADLARIADRAGHQPARLLALVIGGRAEPCLEDMAGRRALQVEHDHGAISGAGIGRRWAIAGTRPRISATRPRSTSTMPTPVPSPMSSSTSPQGSTASEWP